MKNKFYITNSKKDFRKSFTAKKSWVDSPTFDKQPLNGSENEGVFYPIDVTGVSKLSYTFEEHRKVQGCTYTFLDTKYNKVGLSQWVPYMYDTSKDPNSNEYEVDIPSGVSYVAITVLLDADISSTEYNYKYFDFKPFYSIMPHYKSLKINTKKENDQVFFRDTVDGKIMLHGYDCDLVMNADLESQFYFYLYQDDKLVIKSKFSKTDCKFDGEKHSAEIKLIAEDQYTNILDKYENTYDLVKLAVGKTKIKMFKRAILQIYILGDSYITSYINGTVYEHNVINPIYDLNTLKNTYYFGSPETFRELSLSGFNYNINASIGLTGGESKIVAKSGRQQFILEFVKIANSGERLNDFSLAADKVLKLSDGTTRACHLEEYEESYSHVFDYDTYQIKLRMPGALAKDGTDVLYESSEYYGDDNNFTLAATGNKYEMVYIEQKAPMVKPSPDIFYLGHMIITHNVCMRILCDTKTSADGTVTLYDLPVDDFAIEKSNYRYCIGLNNTSRGKKFIHVVQSNKTQTAPTPYGLTEQGTYFVQPDYIIGDVVYNLYPFPLSKSSWGNTSLWIGFEEYSDFGIQGGLEVELTKFKKQIEHKDAMEIGAVIKALLNEIDQGIMFESTSEYSEFLYANSSDIGTSKYNQRIYITQKSNILKGEYDQAALKSEITLKSVLEMLRDCFRCYWFIDEKKRFRIEHIKYFNNGLSYSVDIRTTLDLDLKKDKFNKKSAVYCQKNFSYAKSEMSSRYEFSWGDNAVSEAMGSGFNVNVISSIVQSDKKETISLQNFTSDVDTMFYKPEDFSKDGYALISVSAADNIVPIDYLQYSRAKHPTKIVACCQNIYMSFLYLFDNYLYDMPSRTLESSIDAKGTTAYRALDVKKTMETEITACIEDTVSPYDLVKTGLGVGTIEAMKRDIDTGLAEITLRYKPS